MTSISPQTEQRLQFSERQLRPSIDEDIKQDPYKLSHRTRMFIRNMTNRYTKSDHEISIFKIDLPDLWYMCIQAAKAIPEAEPAADQLACQVLRARNFGTMSRVVPGTHAARREEAIATTQGRIWVDLPFLVLDLQHAWAAAASSDMTVVEKCNLVGFTARLASFGVHSDELISCALDSFAKTLESSSEADLVDQVPVALAWLRHGAFFIFSASARKYTSENPQIVATPGELFERTDSEVGPGFSIARWDFWKQRFEELGQQEGLTSETAEQLKLCFGMMRSPEGIIEFRDHARDDAVKAYFQWGEDEKLRYV